MENYNLAGAPLQLYRPSRHLNSMPQQCSTRHFCANLFVHGALDASGVARQPYSVLMACTATVST